MKNILKKVLAFLTADINPTTPKQVNYNTAERVSNGDHLTLRTYNTGRKSLVFNNGKHAILKPGDQLEMLYFNRHIWRQMRIYNKNPTRVVVTENKKQMMGIEYEYEQGQKSFMPFNAMNGTVTFRVIKTWEPMQHQGYGTFETI